MSSKPLPMERGTTQSAPGWAGERFYDEKRHQHLLIVKNTDAAALAAKRVVRYEDLSEHEVDYAVLANDGPMVAGVVDPLLGANTVAVNKHCYIVTGGICTVAVGSGSSVMIADHHVMVGDAEVGKVILAIISDTGGGSLEIGYLRDAIGIAQASANADANVEILLFRR